MSTQKTAPEATETLATRERLLQIAFQLFHEQGFHATGVATILREAGVNPGSMYHHFKSKDDLLLKVLEFALDYLVVAVMEPVESATTDPIERIDALLAQYRARMKAAGCRMGCPMGNLAPRGILDLSMKQWLCCVNTSRCLHNNAKGGNANEEAMAAGFAVGCSDSAGGGGTVLRQ